MFPIWSNAFIQLNNRLYDVTNGQAFIDTVAILIMAHTWRMLILEFLPAILRGLVHLQMGRQKNIDMASVYLPPVWDGDALPSIEMIYNTEQIDPATSTNVNDHST